MLATNRALDGPSLLVPGCLAWLRSDRSVLRRCCRNLTIYSAALVESLLSYASESESLAFFFENSESLALTASVRLSADCLMGTETPRMQVQPANRHCMAAENLMRSNHGPNLA